MQEEYLTVIGKPLSVQQKRRLVEIQNSLINAVTVDDYYKIIAIYGEIANRYEVD